MTRGAGAELEERESGPRWRSWLARDAAPASGVDAGGSAVAPRGPQPLVELPAVGLFLIAVVLAVLGKHLADGGFYYDDWAAAATAIPSAAGGGGFLDLTDSYLNSPAFNSRPVMSLLMSAAHTAFGADASLHIATALVLSALASLCLYALLRELRVPIIHSVAMSLLLLLFPWSDSTRLWSTVGLNNVAICLVLLGALVALRALSRPGGRRTWAAHFLSTLLYAAAVLTYEAAATLVPVAVLLYLTRASARAAIARSAVDVVAVAVALLLVRAADSRDPQSLSESFAHLKQIALEARTLVASAAVPFGSVPRALPLAAMLAILVAGFCAWRWIARNDRELRRWLAVAGVGGVAIGAAYLMFVPAGAWYVPLQPGHGNRVNALAAIGITSLLYGTAMTGATLLLRERQRRATLVAAAGVAVALVLLAGWIPKLVDDRRNWDRAAALQEQVLSVASEQRDRFPPGSTFYTFNHPGSTAVNVPVFVWITDLSGALQVRLGTSQVAGYPIYAGAQVVCGRDGVHPQGSGYSPGNATAYGKTYFLDAAAGSIERISSPPQCRAAAPRFQPGAGVVPSRVS